MRCRDEGRLVSSARVWVDPLRRVVAWREGVSDMRGGEGCVRLLPAMGAREIKAVDGVRPWPGC